METAVIFDTECTGLEAPDVIQLAWSEVHTHPPVGAYPEPWQVKQRFFKPSKPISLGAMAVHHIIDEDLAHEDPWPGKWQPPGDFVIGHNIDFDWKAVGSPPDVKRICTLAMARHIWQDLEQYNLGALSFHVSTDRNETRNLLKRAHDASTDVHLTRLLLQAMLAELAERKQRMQTWSDVWAFSEVARVPLKFTFGKYRGELISEIRYSDPRYINWCLGVPDFANDPYLYKALTGRDLVAREEQDYEEDFG